eukprot:TRINITY_DN2949_c0_g1_i1.p1 TRINITY_DN2949_c0_g1~~TRINITY_DN2949_c0_g1_i1.p1  ORF type:complete len:209 (+),score=26.54 TRINITY_DN2949_c0_g1_i1:182-808(+)
MKPEKTWLPDQRDKEDIARKSLITAAPKLANFFGTLHGAISEIDKLLVYESKLTADQQQAIEAMPTTEEKVVDDDDDEKVGKNESDPDRIKWDEQSEVLIYSKSADDWFCGYIADIKYDERGEWLTIEYTLNGDDDEKTEKASKCVEIQRFSNYIKPIGQQREWVKGSEIECFDKSENEWFKVTVIGSKDNDVLNVAIKMNGRRFWEK